MDNSFKILQVYNNCEKQFPIIASVIEKQNKGFIYVNNERNPKHIFVQNKFGFCQEFYTEYDPQFARQLIENIFKKKERMKLRCYAPDQLLEEYLIDQNHAHKSLRIHYSYEKKGKHIIPTLKEGLIRKMTLSDLEKDDFGLNLMDRYYRGKNDFISHAMPFVYICNDQYAGVVYSAGNGLGRSEIDVYVKQNHRRKGGGEALVSTFTINCIKEGTLPSWDCYTNNDASRNLADKTGFIEAYTYDFYNVELTTE